MSELFDSLNFHSQRHSTPSAVKIAAAAAIAAAAESPSALSASTSKTHSTLLRTPDQPADDSFTSRSAGGSIGGFESSQKDGRVYWYAPPSPSLQLQQAEHQRRLAATGRMQPLASQAFREELLGRGGEALHADASTSTLARLGRRSVTTNAATRTTYDQDDSTALSGRRGATRSTSSTAALASTVATGGMRRRQSRRFARRSHSNGVAQQAQLNEGMGSDHIMGDLDQNLPRCVVGSGEDDPDGACKAAVSPNRRERDTLQQLLIEQMDRAFSQDERASHRRRLSQQTAALGISLLGDADKLGREATLIRTSTWARTSSMPTASLNKMLAAGTSSKEQRRVDALGNNAAIDADVFALTGAKRMAVPAARLGKRELPHSPGDEMQVERTGHVRAKSINSGQDDGSPSKPVSRPSRNSPNKRCAVAMLDPKLVKASQPTVQTPSASSIERRGGMSRTVSEGAQQLSSVSVLRPANERVATKGGAKKTISAPNARGPPRVGLSRSAAPSGQLNMSQSVPSPTKTAQNGPSAPFKQPTRRSPRKPALHAASAAPDQAHSKSKSASVVVVLDDSSDDEGQVGPKAKAKVTKSTPFRSFNKSPTKAHAFVRKKASSSSPLKRHPPPPAPAHDGDVSFDTSLDDVMLCQALDEVEASQKVLHDSQCPQALAVVASAPVLGSKGLDRSLDQPPSDDSFAVDDSLDADISAAISRMDQEGW